MLNYYFDASDSGPTDLSSGWGNDANAFDGSPTTIAFASGTSGQFLTAGGTNAPNSGLTIGLVRIRVGATDMSGFRYYSYVTLNRPSGGWDWTKLSGLVIRVNTFTNDIIPVAYLSADTTFTTPLCSENFFNTEATLGIIEIQVSVDDGPASINRTFEVGNGMSRSEMAN